MGDFRYKKRAHGEREEPKRSHTVCTVFLTYSPFWGGLCSGGPTQRRKEERLTEKVHGAPSLRRGSGLPIPPGHVGQGLALFWVIALRVGHCSWYRVGRGQGHCQPACEAHYTPAPNRIALAQSVHSAAVEKPIRWSMSGSNEGLGSQGTLKMETLRPRAGRGVLGVTQ